MTHAHDRTLLAKMGFADPDKRNGLHDDLCAYLASKDASLTLVREVGKRINWFGKQACAHEILTSAGGRKWCSFEVECSRFKNPAVKLELALVKGHGQYATTVGFFDVYLEGIQALGDCPDHGERRLGGFDIVVEVKAGKVSPSDLLRQINLYRSIPAGQTSKTQWVVFTGFRYGADDAALLEREGIHVFCAGAKFEAWQRARSETQAADGGTEI